MKTDISEELLGKVADNVPCPRQGCVDLSRYYINPAFVCHQVWGWIL